MESKIVSGCGFDFCFDVTCSNSYCSHNAYVHVSFSGFILGKLQETNFKKGIGLFAIYARFQDSDSFPGLVSSNVLGTYYVASNLGT